MKAKVLKYKFDGNTVVAPYMELEAYAENIYLSLSDKNEYGNENYDYFHVVCKVENISPFCRSVFLKNSDLTQFLCCKPVKRTGRNRNKDGRSKKNRKRRNAGWRKRSGNRNLTRRNKSF